MRPGLSAIGFTLALVLGVSVFFRFWHLDTIPGWNGDEAWLGWKAVRAAQGMGLDWKTNSGNLTNPFFILPSIAVHTVMEPSGVALRLVAALSGVLLLPVVFFLVRPLYGTPTAWFALLLTAILPINLLYARFGWEPSQSVLFSWPVVALALGMARADATFWRWTLAATLAWGAAMLVHPTSFFLAPLLGLSFLPWLWQKMPSARVRSLVVVGMGIGFLLLLAAGAWAVQSVPFYIRDAILARWSTGNWTAEGILFVTNVARLFTGLAVASTLGASASWQKSWLGQNWGGIPAVDVIFWGITLLALGVVFWPRSKGKEPSSAGTPLRGLDKVLIAYLACGLGIFFVLCGGAQLNPGVERYGLWMIPAFTLLWARAAGILWESGRSGRILGAVCVLLLCAGSLGFFYKGYFRHFQETGGQGSLASRTSKMEPKQFVVEKAREELEGTESALLLASEDWFMIWPLAYLLAGNPASSPSKVQSIFLEPWKRLGTLDQYQQALEEGTRVWRVEYADHPSLQKARETWSQTGFSWEETSVLDAGGNPVLIILKTPSS